MGDPVAIVDLAHDLIRLSGLEVGWDISRFT
jgi:FlaA1/EpsC-like NDP-sugar epimerase